MSSYPLPAAPGAPARGGGASPQLLSSAEPDSEPDEPDQQPMAMSDEESFIQLFAAMKINPDAALRCAQRLVAEACDTDLFSDLSSAELKADFGFAIN